MPKPTYVQVGLSSKFGYLFTWVLSAPDVKIGATLTLADSKPIWTIRWIGEARMPNPPRKGWKAKILVRKDGGTEPRPSFDVMKPPEKGAY